jgi:hypothetical protein
LLRFDDIALPNEDVFEDNWLGPFPDWSSFFGEFPSDFDFDFSM